MVLSLEDRRLILSASPFLDALLTELAQTQQYHKKLNSLHEAYAVIAEEVDELWDIVRQKREVRDPAQTRRELLQIAAMAWRTAIDLQLDDLKGASHA